MIAEKPKAEEESELDDDDSDLDDDIGAPAPASHYKGSRISHSPWQSADGD